MELSGLYSYIAGKSCVGCYSVDGNSTIVPLPSKATEGSRLFDIYDNKLSLRENVNAVRIVHESVNFDVLLSCGSYAIGIDTEKSLFSICNTSNSPDNSKPGISTVVSAFPRRARKIEKYCAIARVSLVFFSSGPKLFVLNLSDYSCSKVKYDILSFDSFEKKNILSNATISSMSSHPARPILTVVMNIMNGSSIILFFNYSNLLGKLVSNDNNDDDNLETESISETASVVSASVTGSTAIQSRSSKKMLDMVGQMIIKPPSANPASRVQRLCYHMSGNILAVAWERDNRCLCIYDTRSFLFEPKPSIKLLDLLIKPIMYPIELVTTGLCFHPNEPLLIHSYTHRHAAMKGSGILTPQSVRAYSYLVPSLPVILEENIYQHIPLHLQELQPIITDLTCSDADGHILVTLATPPSSGASSGTSVIYAVFRLSSMFMNTISIHRPLSSTLSVPPDTYIDGDIIMKRIDIPDSVNPSLPTTTINTTTTPSSWPIIIMAKKSIDISSRGFRLSYDFYRCGLGLGVTTIDTSSSNRLSIAVKKDTRYLGHMDAMINEVLSASSTSSAFAILAPEDIFYQPGCFIASEIKDNEFALNSTIGFIDEIDQPAGRQSFEFLLRGIVIPSGSIISNHSSSRHDSKSPIVCFLRYEKFADTLLAPDTMSASDDRIALDDAYKLHIRYSSFRDAEFWIGPAPSVTVASTDKPAGILGLTSDGLSLKWLALGTTSSSSDPMPKTGNLMDTWRFEQEMRRFFVSPIGAPNVILYAASAYRNTPETLYLSNRGSPALGLNPCHLKLRAGEVTLQAIWQSIPSAYSTKRKTADNERKQQQRVWLTSTAGPLLGVLTNYRVLLLTSSLELMNCHVHTQPKQSDRDSVDTTPLSSNVVSLSWIGCALTYASVDGSISYLLPALRLRNLTQSIPDNSLLCKLSACGMKEDDFRHGRLCSMADSVGSIQLVACLPDRLIFSCIEQSDGFCSRIYLRTRPLVVVEPIMLGLLIRGLGTYSKKPQSSSTSITAVPTISTQLTSSSQMKDLYHQQRIDMLIQLAISYYLPKKTDSNLSYPPSSHITTKILLAMLACGSPYHHIACLIANIPQEEDAIAIGYQSSGNYPSYRWIPHALRFHVAMRCNRGMSAALGIVYGYSKVNLYDRVQDPSSLIGGLLPYRDTMIMQQLLAAAQALHADGHHIAAQRLASIYNLSAPTASAYDPSAGLSIDQLFARPASLFPPTTTNTASLMPSSSSSNADIVAAIKKLAAASSNRVGLGPPSPNPALAMCCIEDIIGLRSKPEAMSVAPSINRFLSPATSSSSTTSDATAQISSILPSSLATKPLTWIDELDKIVGYWRFSDVIYPMESGFMNTSLLTRMMFIDLSRYAAINSLELVVNDHAVSNMMVDISSSNVDPGEDHERVKLLYDVIYPAVDDVKHDDTQEPRVAELRVLIGRGGPLDIGLYHQDSDRMRMTIEMMIYCGSMQSQHHPVTLLQRRCYSSSTKGNIIYQLIVMPDGTLSWKLNAMEKKSAASVLFDPTSSYLEWKHVVVIVSSTTTSSSINILVNNTSMLQETLSLTQSYPESDLETTMMVIGRDMPAPWRLTELRVWNDIRSSDDLEENKENYLGIASKKKRVQQMRLKGTKDFFKPLRGGYGGVIPSSKPVSIQLPYLKNSAMIQTEPSSNTASTNNEATTSSSFTGERTSVSFPRLSDAGAGKRLSTLSSPPGTRASILQAPAGKRNSTMNPPVIVAKTSPKASADVFEASFAAFDDYPATITATSSEPNQEMVTNLESTDNVPTSQSINIDKPFEAFQDDKW